MLLTELDDVHDRGLGKDLARGVSRVDEGEGSDGYALLLGVGDGALW